MADPTFNELLDNLSAPGDTGYIPVRSTFAPPPQGGVLGAVFRQENIFGSMAQWNKHRLPAMGENDPNFDYLQHIPVDLLDWAGNFAHARNEDDIADIAVKLRSELRDRSIMQAHPGRSFLYGFLANLVDPTVLMPGSVFYKEARAGLQLGKSAIGVGLAASGQAAFQEAFLANQQTTREFEESMNNMIASGLFGAAIGGLGGVYSASAAGKAARKQINDVLTHGTINVDNASKVGDASSAIVPNDALRESESLSRLGRIFGKTLGQISAFGRLVNSFSGVAKRFANDMFESDLITNKNTQSFGFEASTPSVDTEIRGMKSATVSPMGDYFDLFYKQKGIEGGFLKGTRSDLSNIGLSIDEFHEATIRTIVTGKEHSVGEVNQAAKLLSEKIFKPLADEAAKVNLLPENVSPANAVGYFAIIYNKPLLIERENEFLGEVVTWLKEQNIVRKQLDPEIQTHLKDITKNENVIKDVTNKINIIENNEKSIEKLKNQITDLTRDLKIAQNTAKQRVESKKENQLQALIKRESEIEGLQKKLTLKEGPLLGDIKTLEKEKSRIISRIRNQRKTDKSVTGIAAVQKKYNERIKKLKSSIEESRKSLRTEMESIRKQINVLESEQKKTQKEFTKNALVRVKDIKNKLDNLNRIKKNLTEQNTKLGKSTKGVDLKAIENEIKEIKKSLKKTVPASLFNSKGEIRPILDDDETIFQGIAKQIFDNIVGGNDDKVNPIFERATKSPGQAKPLDNRAFLIPHERILKWTIQDVPRVVQSYVNGMSHAIAMERYAQRLGLDNSSEILEHFKSLLNVEFDNLKKGKSPKELRKLQENKNAIVKDMIDSMKIIQGVFGAGPNVISGKAGEFVRAFNAYNFVRLMGFMTLSSLSDAAMVVFKNGFFRAMFQGFLPVLQQLEAVKADKGLLRSIGKGMETFHATRLKSYVDQSDISQPTGTFGKTMDALSQKFGNVNLINQWSDFLTHVAGRAFIHKTLKSIDTWSKTGKMSSKERTRLANLFLGDEEFKEIAKAFDRHGSKDGGSYYMNWGDWDITDAKSANAFNRFRLAMLQDLDSTVIIPGKADLPNFARTNLGRFMLQFRSWSFAATNKILASGLQRRDAEVASGVFGLLAMGAMSYIVTQLVRGNEPDLSFDNLAFEAIDRSGLIGITAEVFNIGQKMFGLDGASRYASRGVISSFLGPSVGTAEDSVVFINKVIRSMRGEGNLTTRDWQKIQRLFPYQNLFYMYVLNKKLTDSVAKSLGAVESK